jgi:hypothetical protein
MDTKDKDIQDKNTQDKDPGKYFAMNGKIYSSIAVPVTMTLNTNQKDPSSHDPSPSPSPSPSLNHDDDIHRTIPVNWASLLMKQKMIQYRSARSRTRAL